MQFSRVAIHEIPEGSFKSEGSERVVASRALAEFDRKTLNFISDSMVQIGHPHSKDIQEDEEINPRAMPDLLRNCLNGTDEEFLNSSITIAEKLFQAQTGTASSGVLIVALVQEPRKELLIMKAEHQEGMRVRQETDNDGNLKLSLEHLTELIVGGNARIFKSARLWLDETQPDQGRYFGVMIDLQNGGTGYAEYFLSGFLEARLSNPNSKLTSMFLATGQKLIGELDDTEEKLQVAEALRTYSNTNQEFEVSARTFAELYLTDDQANKYVRIIPEELRGRSFRMDRSGPKSETDGWKLSAPGFYLVVDSDAVRSGEVSITENDDGSSEIRISKHLKDFTFIKPPKK